MHKKTCIYACIYVSHFCCPLIGQKVSVGGWVNYKLSTVNYKLPTLSVANSATNNATKKFNIKWVDINLQCNPNRHVYLTRIIAYIHSEHVMGQSTVSQLSTINCQLSTSKSFSFYHLISYWARYLNHDHISINQSSKLKSQ